MKDNQSFEKDEALSQLLRTWQPDAPLPPRFQEGVWNRIARVEAPRPNLWRLVVVWLEKTISRPAMAASYVAILLVAGLGAGYWQGEGKSAKTTSELRSRYVQAVDPYQMPR
jgi:hypothetical protein